MKLKAQITVSNRTCLQDTFAPADLMRSACDNPPPTPNIPMVIWAATMLENPIERVTNTPTTPIRMANIQPNTERNKMAAMSGKRSLDLFLSNITIPKLGLGAYKTTVVNKKTVSPKGRLLFVFLWP